MMHPGLAVDCSDTIFILSWRDECCKPSSEEASVDMLTIESYTQNEALMIAQSHNSLVSQIFITIKQPNEFQPPIP